MIPVKMVADKISKFQSKILSWGFIRSHLLIVLNQSRNCWTPESRSEIGVNYFKEVKSQPSFLGVVFK